MARKSKLTSTEIEELELSEDNRRKTRNMGFAKMKERDLGYGFLVDYQGKRRIVMDWRMSKEHEANQLFKLVLPGGQTLVLDAEQLRRHLRWV